jgi:ribosomal protein S18 acetylase RimI-like enzyme
MTSPVDSQRYFPQLPNSFTDQAGRSIHIDRYDGEPEPLIEMYEEFDTGSFSQGVPPRTRSQIEEWVTHLLEEGNNVVAYHDGKPVGHTVMLPHDDTSELAIFVHPAYQSAGIGTKLIRAVLGYSRAKGIDHVWLTVARDNRIALRLYKSAGFEIREEKRGELEMEREL